MTEKLLSELTTAQIGGPAKTYVRATSEAEIIEAVSAADAAGDPVLIVGGGSNLLVSGLAFAAIVVSSINIFGGFAVTDRMLGMFVKEEA